MTDDESTVYEHRQNGWWVLGIFVGALLLIVLPTFLLIPKSDYVWLTVSAVPLVAAGGLFSSLTVRVTEEAVEWWFGPGLWTYSAPLSDIERVQVTSSSSWEGWGIRYTSKGPLYNVSGWDAVGIEKTDGTYLRIGTDEPKKLKQAIDQAREPT